MEEQEQKKLGDGGGEEEGEDEGEDAGEDRGEDIEGYTAWNGDLIGLFLILVGKKTSGRRYSRRSNQFSITHEGGSASFVKNQSYTETLSSLKIRGE